MWVFFAGERGQLVLAGDPKQLGPVIRAPVAVRHGLATSLLERLMATNPVYAKPYNNACITKLLKNFRYYNQTTELSRVCTKSFKIDLIIAGFSSASQKNP